MFLPNSRYARVATVDTTSPTGEIVVALKLRRLPPVDGESQVVQAGDRLDLIAHARTGDATQFWHIADANSELDARALCAVPGEPVIVPRS